jgi:hypothetical protein
MLGKLIVCFRIDAIRNTVTRKRLGILLLRNRRYRSHNIPKLKVDLDYRVCLRCKLIVKSQMVTLSKGVDALK